MLDPEKIYKEYSKTVFRYLYAKTGDSHISEEITQETFYQAIRRISSFDGSCKVTTWLCAIAKNQLLKYYRKHPRHCDIDDIGDLADNTLSADYFSEEGKVEVLRVMHELPETMREVMHLRIFGSLSFRQIGDIMERSENWARVTYYRGNLRLREKLNGENYNGSEVKNDKDK